MQVIVRARCFGRTLLGPDVDIEIHPQTGNVAWAEHIRDSAHQFMELRSISSMEAGHSLTLLARCEVSGRSLFVGHLDPPEFDGWMSIVSYRTLRRGRFRVARRLAAGGEHG